MNLSSNRDAYTCARGLHPPFLRFGEWALQAGFEKVFFISNQMQLQPCCNNGGPSCARV